MSTKYDEILNSWASEPKLRPDPNISYAQLLINHLSKFGDKVIQLNHDTGYQMTATEMRQKAIYFAENLLKIGIKFSDVVTVLANHHDNLVPIVLGVTLIGAVLNPLDISNTVNDLINLLKLTKPTLVICEGNLVQNLRQSLTAIKHEAIFYTFDGSSSTNCIETLFSGYESVGDTKSSLSLTKLDKGNDSALAILTSSGTTGPPKAVSISHNQAIIGLTNWMKLTEESIYFSTSKLMWITCLAGFNLSILNGALRIITTSSNVTGEIALNIIKTHKVTAFFTTPTVAANMLSVLESDSTQDISTVQQFACAGGLLSNQIIIKMKPFIPIGRMFTLYGMTEVSTVVSSSEFCTKINSIGHLYGGIEAKIVDDSGKSVGPGKLGELFIKPLIKPLGYLGNEQANKDAYDTDGFYHTGDVCYFDKDNCIFMVDRKKEIFKNNLTHITPSELENCILKNIDINNVCIVGIQKNKLDLASFWPAAVVVRNKNSKSLVTETDIYEMIQNNFSDDQHLRGGVYFVDQLPLTANGKVQRKVVTEIAEKYFWKNAGNSA